MTDATPGSDELERHFQAANIALGRGDRAAAAEALRAAVCQLEVRDDSDGPLVAALTRLGELELDAGREVDAEEHFQRALAFGERQLGPEHPDLAVLLNALSRFYLRRGAHDLAEPLLQRLYTIKRTKGEDHPEVATVLASLASLRQLVGRHDAAEQLWRRVLDIRERTLAPNHVATATALERLADTCAARAKGVEAVQLLQRALAMRELTLGSAHPSVRALRERIADVQLQATDDADGEGMAASLAPIVPSRTSSGTTGAWRDAMASVPGTPSPASSMPAVPAPTPVAAYAPLVAPAPLAALAAPPAPSQQWTTAYAPPLPVPSSEPDATAPAAERASRPVTLVVPGATAEGLQLQKMLAELANDMEESEPQLSLSERAATLIHEHRRPAAIAAGTVALLGIAFTVALARGSGNDESPQFDERAGTILSSASTTAPYAPPTTTHVADDALASTAAAAPVHLAADAPESRRESERAPSRATREERDAMEEKAASRESDRRETAAARVPTLGNIPALQLDVMASAMPNVKAPDPVASRLATFSPAKRDTESARPRSDRVQPARLLGAPPIARYPQSLRQTGVEGEVRVVFEVDTTGRPDMRTLVILKSSHELLTASVRNVIPSMRFVPAEIDGKKARWSVRMPFLFAITSAR